MIIRVMQCTICKVTSLFLNRKRASSAICRFMALQRTPGNLHLQCTETCMNLGRRGMLMADGTKPGSLMETRDETNMQKSAYVGLRNQDSACYLNSVLQCLFFTREFREAILSCNNVGDSHIMYHLQRLCQGMTGNSSPNTEEIIQYLRMNNVHQLEVVGCFQLLMNKIIEDKEDFRQPYQVKMVQSTTCHGGSYLMRLEKPDLNLTFCVHKCAPAPTVYSVRSCFETLPQILVIHLKRDPGDINVEVSVPPSLTLKTEKQLDTVYELFVVCHHSGGIQGDQYMVEIKSVENDCWYRFTETQVQEIPEGQICLDEQHSATASLLMYHRVNSDARPITDTPAGPFTESVGKSVIGDTSSEGSRRWNSDVCGDGECYGASGWSTSRSVPSSDPRKAIDTPAGPFTESVGKSVIGDTSSEGSRRWNSDVCGDGECYGASGWSTSRSVPSSDPRKAIDTPAGPFTESVGKSVIGDTSSEGSRRWNSDVCGDGECYGASGWSTSRSVPSSDPRKGFLPEDALPSPSTRDVGSSLVRGKPSKKLTPVLPGTYVGLRNQGSTSYLNSLLQCLFFTRELREAILSFDNGGDSSIVCQLQKLFQELKCNESAPSTKGITKCLGVRDVHQQQDVAEYFRILMNKIVEDKKEIQQLYQVEMVHSIVCHGCEQQTRIKENPVLSLALSLDKCNCKAYSVSNALDAVQEKNEFTGDEQFYCETCESKQDATSRCYFETLPPILVLNLKRYQFDGNWFRKLHYEVSVPFSLPVNLKEQTAENMDFPLSSQILQYELFAVCHHSGGIDGGHYVAEIKSYENECWYSFNDTVVEKMPEDMNTMDAKDSYTAYLLMYRKMDSFAKPRMYVRLRNQSCICYLNSLLHCLFFTRELREAILRCDNVGDSVIVCHLQQLFKKLMTGDSSPTTEKITRALEMGNVRQQLNVKECFQLLMNKIIEDKEDIQQLYQVKMVHRITCHGCHHQKMLKKSDLSICVSVQKQNSNCALYSVDHALADMQEEHPYTGDGQHYCQCYGNQRSTQCYCFETLPQILVIHLERDPVDINAGVSVPLSLTLTTGKQLYTDYELFGICHHIGAIHGDHYTAEVKSLEDNHWYHFNDKGVSEVSEEQISSKVQNSDTVSLLMYHKVNSDAKPDSSMWGRLSPVTGCAELMRAADPQQKPDSKKKKSSTAQASLGSWPLPPFPANC
ncbi:uncharacterized protein LOC114022685 isoform X4 [Chelonia mydas]|uniref:uncharacterized protein LOC114022685 isoform X4 n=1 Tax=Chelonia mydas TaxID=8469 RepID=UPI001CAA24EF|nr:uncharacterized protein LOC114022685 isoform X4 [Chelonia mydas]